MSWWRFWQETFICLSDGDLFDYWCDTVARIICPCSDKWRMVYWKGKMFPANDNERRK